MTSIATETATKSIGIGSTVENGTLRIHRFNDHLVLWDTTNAGKRGKKVAKASVSSLGDWASRGEHQERLSQLLVSYSEFQDAIATLRDLLTEYPGSLSIDHYEERGIDVVPASLSTIKIRTSVLSLEVSPRDFCIRDLKDKNNEPTAIPAIKGGKRAVQAFYHFLKSNRLAIAGMTYRELLQTMSRRGLSYHDYCAMD
jgi:hypothetical protein